MPDSGPDSESGQENGHKRLNWPPWLDMKMSITYYTIMIRDIIREFYLGTIDIHENTLVLRKHKHLKMIRKTFL